MIDRNLFLVVLAASMALFMFSLYRRLGSVTIGSGAVRTNSPGERIAGVFTHVFGQKRVLQRKYGLVHFFIFWFFMVLTLANAEFILSGLVPGLTLSSLLPEGIAHPLLFLFDVVSLLTIVAIAAAVVRRAFFAPASLDYAYAKGKSGEAFLVLGLIATLMVAYFVLQGAAIALGHGEAASWMPISRMVAAALAGMPEAGITTVGTAAWWVHAAALLIFLNLLPYSKHFHVITAIPSIFFRPLHPNESLQREEFTPNAKFGVGQVDQFSWKDLMDGFSCAECGRCQDRCPACSTGKSANPRQVVHNIKVNLLKNAALLEKGEAPVLPLIGKESEGTVDEEALWDCTTCGSCVATCPLMIEHMPKIVKMRRYLVEEEARFPEELLNLFENVEQRGNPWGLAPSEREKWYTTLGDRSYNDKCEYLLFVGCAGALDSRSRVVTASLATILDKAGITWGVLGKDELCCGDSLRRLGNEYVFDKLAKKNVAKMQELGVKKIVTQCPHCFNTLANDYRQYGLEVEVVSHSVLINDLIAQGKLPLSTEAGKSTVFHDPCYLGRHNGIVDQPRQVLKAAGSTLLEAENTGATSFCCGAGGGRMWMEETVGERINLTRVKEVLDQKPEQICVSCPFCLTMFEDGLKDVGAESVAVKDIAEVVAAAMK